MKILLTGATGFIGSEVLAQLQRAGHAVTCVSLWNWWRSGLPEELNDAHDAIIHCAWGGVGATDRDDFEAQQRNIELFARLLACAEKNPPKVIIGFGSQAELYRPETQYGAAKKVCREMIRRYGDTAHARWLWLQFFSVYGEGESEQWLIPYLTRKFLKHEPVDLTPADQEMDYMHVSDAAKAVLAGLHSEACGVFQVGAGCSWKLREIVQKLHSYTDSRSRINFGALPYRPDQIMSVRSRPESFAAITGWNRDVSLTDGLESVVGHIRQQISETRLFQ